MKFHSPLRTQHLGFLIVCAVFSITLFTSKTTYAQVDACTPIGWATQNGGVTGGGSATPTVATTYAQLKSAITTASVKVVHISGVIEIPSGGRINFQDQSGKTIIGLPGSKLFSNDLTAANSGILYVKRCSNLIFRNITFVGPAAFDEDGNDNMTIDNSTNIWVDHCEFHDGMDGNLDIKNASNYISVTWTKFSYEKAPIPGGSGGSNDHRFSNLIGSSDTETQSAGKLKITFQYCWWAQGCVERMPRVRFGQLHIVNNLYSSTVSKYCILAGFDADLLIENNAFIGVKTPIDLTQGTFTGVTARNNIFVSTTGNQLGSGTSFTPPYPLTIANAAVLNTNTFKNCVGATLPAPPLTCPCNVGLSIEVLSFDILKQQENYLLSWSVANPEKIEQVGIELSIDGKTFALETSLNSEATEYLLSPAQEFATNTFYVRLKFIETNGEISYSSVKTIGAQNQVVLYPNPTRDKVSIVGMKNGLLVLYTMDGKKLYEEVLSESGDINFSWLAAGSYIVELTDSFSKEQKRISFLKY